MSSSQSSLLDTNLVCSRCTINACQMIFRSPFRDSLIRRKFILFFLNQEVLLVPPQSIPKFPFIISKTCRRHCHTHTQLLVEKLYVLSYRGFAWHFSLLTGDSCPPPSVSQSVHTVSEGSWSQGLSSLWLAMLRHTFAFPAQAPSLLSPLLGSP